MKSVVTARKAKGKLRPKSFEKKVLKRWVLFSNASADLLSVLGKAKLLRINSIARMSTGR